VGTTAKHFWLVQGLTVSRVVCAFIFIVLAPSPDLAYPTSAVYLFAWVSDFLDGQIARRWGVSSKVGGALDIFGDRYLLVLSCIYAGFRGVYLAALAIILLREIFSVAMRMVQVQGRGIIVSNRLVGGAVHTLIAIGTVSLLLMPTSQPILLNQLPFVTVALFYLPYLPYTIYRSRARIVEAIKADVSDL
jgi:phosphatidylglycerophosphate synthase